MQRVEMIRERVPGLRDHDRHHRRLPGRDRGGLPRDAGGRGRGRLRLRVHVRLLAAPRHRGRAAARTRSRTPVKRERMERLVELVQRRALERSERFVGTTQEVLVEGPSRTDPARLRGRTRHNKTVNFTGLAQPGELVAGRDHRRDVDDARRRGVAASRASPDRRSRSSGRPGSARPRSRSSWRSCCARAARTGRRVGRRDPGLRGPGRARGQAGAAEPARAPAGLVRAGRRGVQRRAASPSGRTREIDALLDRGPHADRGRRHGPLPARGADRAGPAARRRSPACASELERELAEVGAGGAARRGCRRATAADGASERPQADRARAGAGADGQRRRTRASDQLWSERAAPPDRAVRPRRWTARLLDARIGARVRAMLAGGAVEEVERRSSAAPRAPRARRSASRRSRRTWRASASLDEAPSGSSAATSPTCKRQLTWMRKLAGVELIDRTGARRRGRRRGAAHACRSIDSPARAPMTLRFEKWQALGNDYIIVERDELPFELTPERVRRMCAPHFGCHSDGVLLLAPPERRALRGARCGSSTPTARRRSCRGNGAREAILYLRRHGWTDERRVLDRDRGRRDAADDHVRRRTCSVEMGRARLQLARLPVRRRRRPRRAVIADGRELEFQHVSIGNPQCVIAVGETSSSSSTSAAIGPPIERSELFPNRTNVAFIRRRRRRPRCARGSSSAGWGRRCRPAPAPPARRWPRVLRGATQPGDRAPRRRRAGGRGDRRPGRDADRLGRSRCTAGEFSDEFVATLEEAE